MSLTFITKRKLARAVALAVSDRKIPAAQSEPYRYGGEAGLVWESLNMSAPIHVRSDGTIYIGHASPFERGSHFDSSRVGFTPLK